MDNGFIKLHRKFIEWEWFDKSEMVQLFIYFLVKANHTSKKWRGIDIERGQFLTSLETISKDTKLSTQTIRTCLKRLKSTNEITNKSTKQYRIITICNYDSYQTKEKPTNKEDNQQSNSQLTNEQQTTNKQLTITKNEKNEKNNIPPYNPPTGDEEKRVDSSFSNEQILKAEEIYSLYPRRSAQEKSTQAILACFEKIRPDELYRKVKAFSMHTEKWETDNRRFIPSSEKYFIDGRWSDDLSFYDCYLPKNNSSQIPFDKQECPADGGF